MKIGPALTAIALALFTMGCSNSAPGTADAHEPHAEAYGNDVHDHAEVENRIPKVVLDDGKRWIANAETTEGIARMSALITGFDPVSGDAKALKAGLEEEFALIFERCTMTGEAHEQLHNYLLPIHQELGTIDLSNAEERDELKAYLGTYGSYFE